MLVIVVEPANREDELETIEGTPFPKTNSIWSGNERIYGTIGVGGGTFEVGAFRQTLHSIVGTQNG